MGHKTPLLLALLCTVLLGALPAYANEGEEIHVVVLGDNLYRISQRYSISIPALMQANGLTNPDYIVVGQELRIPTADMVPALVAAAPAAPPEASPRLATASNGWNLHVVAPNETLSHIAQAYGVSSAVLAQANGIATPNYIRAGQALLLPGPGTPLVSPAALAPGPATVAPAPGLLEADYSQAPYFKLTHYCLLGRMASGRSVYSGAVAADASIFRLGTRVIIEGLRGVFNVEDRFGWDGGEARLDLWVPTCNEAIRRGVEYRRVLRVVD